MQVLFELFIELIILLNIFYKIEKPHTDGAVKLFRMKLTIAGADTFELSTLSRAEEITFLLGATRPLSLGGD
ncbi:MAG: hypothetical protein QG589_373 [Patescibacteria group bacterium]|nr:hypothetical protein [Patescibacteria group bacterium]